MSYDSYEARVWIGDLDDYLDLNSLDRNDQALKDENEKENCVRKVRVHADDDLTALDGSPDDNINLFAGCIVKGCDLKMSGIDNDKWRWFNHRAQLKLYRTNQCDTENSFLKSVISEGRYYAISRYAQFENIQYAKAITAVFTYGIRALLIHYLESEKGMSTTSNIREIQRTLHLAGTLQLNSYEKTTMVRDLLHEMAIAEFGHSAHLKIDKERTRVILSLVRLFFLNREMYVENVNDLLELDKMYRDARTREKHSKSHLLTGKRIKNWKLRHLHPLTFYFPISARDSFSRLVNHLDYLDDNDQTICSKIAANELALIFCEREIMRKQSKEREPTRA